jgi:hypothetical protein
MRFMWANAARSCSGERLERLREREIARVARIGLSFPFRRLRRRRRRGWRFAFRLEREHLAEILVDLVYIEHVRASR